MTDQIKHQSPVVYSIEVRPRISQFLFPKVFIMSTQNNVYIRSEEFAWVPARLVEQDNTQAKVAIPQYSAEEFIMSDGGKAAVGFKSAIVKLKDYQNASLPLQNVGADGSLKEVDDMVDLPYLHEVCNSEVSLNLDSILFGDSLFQLSSILLSSTGRHIVQLEEETH
jgi:hypothetical protein